MFSDSTLIWLYDHFLAPTWKFESNSFQLSSDFPLKISFDNKCIGFSSNHGLYADLQK